MPEFSCKNRFLFFCTMLICHQAGAQTISGRITNRNQEPLSLVSVLVLKDSGLLLATTTNGQGYFQLIAAFQKEQTYVLRVSLVGYRPLSLSFVYPDTGSLSKLSLEEDGKLLQGIAVIARKPLVTRRADRYIVNVENSILANGRSALDVLQQSPGVWVDNNGGVRLKGRQAVMVMINDVVQRMTEEELADYLRSLKSEDISRIEVIPMPPAEFEAAGSGGIIHIILKKGRKNGWNGSVNTQYWQQENHPYFTLGTTLNYQFRKIYLSGTYAFVHDRRSIQERTDIFRSDHSSFHNATQRVEKIQRHQYRLWMVYDITAAQSISLQAAVSGTAFQHVFNSNEVFKNALVSTGQARSEKDRRFDLSAVTLNYTLRLDTCGGMIRFIADYTSNERSETNSFSQTRNDPPQQSFRRNRTPINTEIYSLQSDYTQPLNSKAILRAGVKYASISRDNRLATEDLTGTGWVENPGLTNRFVYKENLLMFYSSMEKTIRHTVLKAGLRLEETFSVGHSLSPAQKFRRRYAGLFPSVFVTRTLNAEKGTSLSAAYSRRLTRPSLSDLNPARLQFSSYTALTGNPGLMPQYSHNLLMTWQFLQDHSAELYLTRTNNSIALSARPGPDNSIDYYSENTGTTMQYGLSFTSTLSPVKKWTILNSFAAYHSAYRFHDLDYNQTSFSAKSLHMVVVEKFADIDVTADYRSAYIYTNLYTYGNFNLDMGFTKKLFKTAGRLRLGFTDVLNSSREKELTNEGGSRIMFYRKRPTRTARLSFTYNFSAGKKLTAKKIEQGSADEKGRIGN